jgi:transcription elongation factor Elf1
MIGFNCPRCGALLWAPTASAGHPKMCGRCNATVSVPVAQGALPQPALPTAVPALPQAIPVIVPTAPQPAIPVAVPSPLPTLTCPNCRARLSVPEQLQGQKVACGVCGQHLRFSHTPPAKTVMVPLEQPPPPLPAAAPAGQTEAADPLPRRVGSYEPCPKCGSTRRPRIESVWASSGCTFLVFGIFFWPFILVGLLLHEKYEVCRDCGYRSKISDATLLS